MRIATLLAMAVSLPLYAVEPASLIEKINGCYRVSFRFREGGKGRDATDLVKERLSVEKLKGKDGFVVHHTTIIDKEAEGDDPIIAQHKNDATPYQFTHLHEEWEPVKEKTWKQTTYGPTYTIPFMNCSGDFLANEWSCDVEKPVRMLRRDSLKKRTDFKDMKMSQQIVFADADEKKHYYVVHQRNVKFDAAKDPVSVELGSIYYEKLDDKACPPAKK